MNIARWGPHRELRRFEDEMRRVFDDFFPAAWEEREQPVTDWQPRIDVSENDSEILVEAELPGLKKDNVHVALENNVLTIKGERTQEEQKKQGTYFSTERRYGSFYRALKLPTPVDDKNSRAHFSDGVLNITMPKKEKARPKQIDIDVK